MSARLTKLFLQERAQKQQEKIAKYKTNPIVCKSAVLNSSLTSIKSKSLKKNQKKATTKNQKKKKIVRYLEEAKKELQHADHTSHNLRTLKDRTSTKTKYIMDQVSYI
jgi:hypothetical protein